MLGHQKIGNLLSAELTDSEDGYRVLIKDVNEKNYLLYIYKNYQLEAIYENNEEGRLIYWEIK